MARMSAFDLGLLILAIVFVVLDIILALCFRLVLPMYMSRQEWYPADGNTYKFKEAAAICPCLNRIFHHGTKHDITFQKISKKAVYKRSVQVPLTTRTRKYPYLVSMSIPAYNDDDEQKIFACNGLVQSSEWLVTVNNCVQEDSEWYALTVRSESPFWSAHGQEHSVVDVQKDDYNLIRLKVFPKFSEKVVPVVPITYPYDGNWTYAISLGWDDQMYKKRLISRYKYKMFDVEEWTKPTANSKSRKVCHNSWKCRKVSSTHLLTSCRQILGQKSLSNNFCSAPSDFNSLGDKKQKCYKIYEDTHVLKDVEVCQT